MAKQSKMHITKAGTQLPIMDLKGKDYMMVAHRMVWFREENPYGTIETALIDLKPDSCIFRATIAVPNDKGILTCLATATKREDAKGFADFIEKAETGAIGRALALAGYGTQFALPELAENDRLADAPLEMPETKTRSTFRKPELVATATGTAPVKIETMTVTTTPAVTTATSTTKTTGGWN